MNDRQLELLKYMVSEDAHVEAGNSEGRGIAPFATLAAMERRGLVELSWKRQSGLYGSTKPYRIARITEAGKDLRRRMWKAHAAAIQDVIGSHLSDEEAAQLARLLDRLRGCCPDSD